MSCSRYTKFQLHGPTHDKHGWNGKLTKLQGWEKTHREVVVGCLHKWALQYSHMFETQYVRYPSMLKHQNYRNSCTHERSTVRAAESSTNGTQPTRDASCQRGRILQQICWWLDSEPKHRTYPRSWRNQVATTHLRRSQNKTLKGRMLWQVLITIWLFNIAMGNHHFSRERLSAGFFQ